MTNTISRDELKQKIDRKDDTVLVETLPATAHQHAHLPGAINLPPDRGYFRRNETDPKQERRYRGLLRIAYLTCFEHAARELAALTYGNVRDYAEGKSDWTDAGLPTESEHRH